MKINFKPETTGPRQLTTLKSIHELLQSKKTFVWFYVHAENVKELIAPTPWHFPQLNTRCYLGNLSVENALVMHIDDDSDVARFRLAHLAEFPDEVPGAATYKGVSPNGRRDAYPILGMLVGSTHMASEAAPDMNRIMCMEFDTTSQSWKNYFGTYLRWAKVALLSEDTKETPGAAPVTEKPSSVTRNIMTYFTGKPIANQVLLDYRPSMLEQFPTNLKGSRVTSQIPATRDVTLSLRKNNVQFGYVAFRAGSSEGVLGALTGVRLTAQDSLSLVAPELQEADDTLAHISISLAVFTPTKSRPSHLDYLGDNLSFFGHMGGMGVYYGHIARNGAKDRLSTVITREDWVLLREELEERGLSVNIDSGWKTVGPGNWD